MTSTPVLRSFAPQNADIMNIAKTNIKTDASSFENCMKAENTKNSTNRDVKPSVKQKAVTTDNEATKVKKSVTVETPKNNVSKEKEVTKADVEKVTDAVEETVETIEEELDVTVEEIRIALENLGLSAAALLDRENIPQVVAKLTDSEDTLSLATDDSLYGKFTAINDTIEKKLNRLSEEFLVDREIVEKAIKGIAAEDVIEKPVVPDSPMRTDAVSDVSQLTDISEVIETLEAEAEPDEVLQLESKVEVKKQDAVGISKTTSVETVQNDNLGLSELQKVSDKPKTSDDSSTNLNNGDPLNFVQNLINKAVEVMNEKAESVSYTDFDVQRIINQLTESIKVNVTAETNEISLRLHPETLGTVSVKVAANHEGVLTAEFTAQNESVKAIIESQAIVLKEALEAKGVTVEAVEVMVQSHEFERNLQNQNRNGNGQTQQKKKGLRRIEITEVPNISFDEEETVLREMMKQNGSTVDYSA